MNGNRFERKPLISVVMPVFNGSRTLKEAIGSVYMQTYSDLELIICNDSSTDETHKILESINDERVSIVDNPTNLGSGLSRDRAIELARGKWIATIDADDAWAPERLETLLKEADSSDDTIIFDDIYECHDTSNGLVTWRVMRGKDAFGCNGYESLEVSVDKFVLSERLLIKPIIPLYYIKKYNIRHSKRIFAEDTEFFLKLLALGLKLKYVPTPMYYYRITPGSASSQNNRNTMMREVLGDAKKKFNHSSTIQEAIRIKIIKVARNEKYMQFLMALKNKQLLKALQLVFQFPWLIMEFCWRLVKSIFYHIHRIWHGGHTRGIR